MRKRLMKTCGLPLRARRWRITVLDLPPNQFLYQFVDHGASRAPVDFLMAHFQLVAAGRAIPFVSHSHAW
jgi:hypothetical protein